MKIKNESNYKPSPEGLFNGVCVDIVDLGMLDSKFGMKHKIKVVWEIEEKMEDGRPFTVTQRYNATLGKGSTLRAHLESWRGSPFTQEELKEFELDTILGASCQVMVRHNVNEGITYANVTDVLKAKPDSRLAATGKYIRAKDRPDYKAPSAAIPQEEDDDIPMGTEAPATAGRPF